MTVYLIFDVLVVILSFFIINRKKVLTFYHPGVLLLFYHLLNNSFRFFSVINGANLAFSDFAIFEGATEEELMRAMFWADIALLSSSIGIALAESKPMHSTIVRTFPYNPTILKAILLFTLPIGLWGAATQLYIPSMQRDVQSVGAWGESSYVTMIQSWFGLSLLALIYFKGLKKKYYIPLLIYLFLIAIQGYSRFRLILPGIFLIVTYLYYHKLRWPTRGQFLLLIGCAIVFYPLKTIGRIIQEGGSFSDISVILQETVTSITMGNSEDQMFLDQYAMTLTEIDKQNVIYYGGTLTPLLVSPIPRQFWPEKPKLNQWQVDISSRTRPFDEIGSIATLYGEAYANFRYLGIILIPALLFYGLTRWYKRTLNKAITDIDKFFYTVIFCCLIQVMRDGLISLIVFPIIINMPLFLIYIMHKFFSKRKTVTASST